MGVFPAPMPPEDVVRQKQDLAEHVSSGGTIASWSRIKGNACRRQVYYWLNEDAEFAKAMDIARDCGADAIAEEALSIADDKSRDGPRDNGDTVGRDRLRVYTRLQLLAKWHPKRYGSASGASENRARVEPDEAYL